MNNSSNKYICIHGHFYQPPRENPWIEEIELQDSAYPYHDWNERITQECYAPNTVSRILNQEGRVSKIVNNYEKMSFNFGPTVLDWLMKHSPDTYQAILDADKKSLIHFDGHGSALAQAYNHIIMPLANLKDKITQVYWGIRDFEARFNRYPEGMWLPETAVDTETLEILADHDIKFTILSPYQAKRYLKLLPKEKWKDTNGHAIDPRFIYELLLPSGRSIHLFFYDGQISNAIAFQGLLKNGHNFANKLLNAFLPNNSDPQLVHVATDGETYGHHHRHGDMALAYALNYIDDKKEVNLTNYSQYLSLIPSTHKVEIHENTSWSCAHGIGRWKEHCGCHTGGKSHWNQDWRKPLRDAFDFLRNELLSLYERESQKFFSDPWKTRDEYISVLLNRQTENVTHFLKNHLIIEQPLDEHFIKSLQLLEMQRHCMLMYTSCGWFFSELSGIETIQCIQYSARALQLARNYFNWDGEDQYVEKLEKAKSNLDQYKDGKEIYLTLIKPAIANRYKIAAHYAVSLLIESPSNLETHFAYRLKLNKFKTYESGKSSLIVSEAVLTSNITFYKDHFIFLVYHLGDHNITAGVKQFSSEEDYIALCQDCIEPFKKSNIPQVYKNIDKHFGQSIFSLNSLFKDEQRKVIEHILQSTREDLSSIHAQIIENHHPLMVYLSDLGQPLPSVLKSSAEIFVNTELREELSHSELDHEKIRSLLQEGHQWNLNLDKAGFELILQRNLEKLMINFKKNSVDLITLNHLIQTIEFSKTIGFSNDLWKIQNHYYSMKNNLKLHYSTEWMDRFKSLGRVLNIQD